MRNNILTVLVGFVVLLCSILLFKVGLDKMTDAEAASQDGIAQVKVDLKRHALLYRVKNGDTLWALSLRFYGDARRWPEIAQANDIKDGEGLSAGDIIKIPLSNESEVSPTVAETEPHTLSYDEVAEVLSPGRFAIDDSALDVTLCRLNDEQFPAGTLCVIRQEEDSSIVLSVYDAASDAQNPPVASWVAPAGSQLCELRSTDLDKDGTQEIYTVWETEGSPITSRVFGVVDGQLRVLNETPNDPAALSRIRQSSKQPEQK